MNVDQLSAWIEKNEDLIASEIGDTLSLWYADFQHRVRRELGCQ